MPTGSRTAEKGADFYASKAGARTAALENLNGALADLAKHEQRAGAAATRLKTVESEARAELERTVAEAERELEEARRRAQALYTERLQAARSERGTAEGLVAKARAAVQTARERLLKLVPRPAPSIEEIAAIDAVLHPHGRCICHGEGECPFCLWARASERAEEAEQAVLAAAKGWREVPNDLTRRALMAALRELEDAEIELRNREAMAAGPTRSRVEEADEGADG